MLFKELVNKMTNIIKIVMILMLRDEVLFSVVLFTYLICGKFIPLEYSDKRIYIILIVPLAQFLRKKLIVKDFKNKIIHNKFYVCWRVVWFLIAIILIILIHIS